MNKPTLPRKPHVTKPLSHSEAKPTAQKQRPASKKPKPKTATTSLQYRLLLLTLEIIGLVITAILLIMVLLGYSANWFSGTRFFTNLLPFAVGVLSLIVLTAGLLIAWWRLRRYLQGRIMLLVPVISLVLAILVGWFSMQDRFATAREHFRVLVGGKQAAARVTLAHQVYAAYRRLEVAQVRHMIERAQIYKGVINDAANAFTIDVNLLQGIAAAESSFLPRSSKDGGKGLFQITRVPKSVIADAGKQLAIRQLSLEVPKHNAFIAAATFRYYLNQMQDDLFLSLLAYNIGPTNGGLISIMQDYGATDFSSIQPYLQTLPRDYPIRVLSYALAFRLWQSEGKLLAYEEGKNAVHIQQVGIPGLESDFYDFP